MKLARLKKAARLCRDRFAPSRSAAAAAHAQTGARLLSPRSAYYSLITRF